MNLDEIEKASAASFEAAWANNGVISMLGLDNETAQALWDIAFMACAEYMQETNE